MKKSKEAQPAPAPAIETFGGDYHKMESTFQPRSAPATGMSDSKRRNSMPLKSKRRESQPRGT